MLNGSVLRTRVHKPGYLLPPSVSSLRPLRQLERRDLSQCSNLKNLDPAKSLMLLVELAKAGRWEEFAFVEQSFEALPVKIAEVAIPILIEAGHGGAAEDILARTAFLQPVKSKKKGPPAKAPGHELRALVKAALREGPKVDRSEKAFLNLFDAMVADTISVNDFFEQWLAFPGGKRTLFDLVVKKRLDIRTYRFLRANLDEIEPALANEDQEICQARRKTLNSLFLALIAETYDQVVRGKLTLQERREVLNLILTDGEYDFLPKVDVMRQIVIKGRAEMKAGVQGKGSDEILSVCSKTPAAFVFGSLVVLNRSRAACAQADGEFETAMTYYDLLLELVPDEGAIKREAVSCLYEWATALHSIDGQTRRPLELMERAYAIAPDHDGVKAVMSYFYCLEDNYVPAMPILEVMLVEQEKMLVQLEAAVAVARGQVKTVQEQLRERPSVSLADTNHLQSSIILGRMTSAKNMAEEQLAAFKKGHADTLTNFGHCYCLRYIDKQDPADLERAEKVLNDAEAISDSPYTYYCLAIVLAIKGDFKGSIEFLGRRLKSAHAPVAFMSYFEKILDHVDVALMDEAAFRELGGTIDKDQMNRSRCSKASGLIDKMLEKRMNKLPPLLLDWMNHAVETKGDEMGENEFLGGAVRLDTEVDALIISALNKMDSQLALEDCQRRFELRPSRLLLNTLGGIHLEQGRYKEAVQSLERAVAREDTPHLLLPLINMLEAYRKMGSDHNYKRTLRRLYDGIEAAIKAGVVGQFKFMSYYRVLFEEESIVTEKQPNSLPAVRRVLELLEKNFPDYYAIARARV